MVPERTRATAERARLIYDERLRAASEDKHAGRFVAVEPESGEYFLADTFGAAVEPAQVAYPSRLPHVMRAGHAAALHMGGVVVTGRVDGQMRALSARRLRSRPADAGFRRLD